MLQDRIKKNSEYFRGMEITNGILIVKVLYKDKWGVYPSEDEKIKVAQSEETKNEWYYFGEFSEVTFDDVFDLIENTIEMNLTAAAKIELLNIKFEELKNLFAIKSLDELKTLYFGFNDVIKEHKPKRKYNRKKKVEKEINQDIIEPINNEITDDTIIINEEEKTE